MRIRKKINFTEILLYLLFGAAFLFLYFIGNNGEPFGLALCYAAGSAGLSPVVCALLYVLSALPDFQLHVLALYAGQAFLLFLGFLLQSRLRSSEFLKTGLFPMLCLSLGLGLYIAFAPFTAYELPFFPTLEKPLTQ